MGRRVYSCRNPCHGMAQSTEAVTNTFSIGRLRSSVRPVLLRRARDSSLLRPSRHAGCRLAHRQRPGRRGRCHPHRDPHGPVSRASAQTLRGQLFCVGCGHSHNPAGNQPRRDRTVTPVDGRPRRQTARGGGHNPMSRRLHTCLSRLGGRTRAETPTSRDDPENEITTALFSCPVCERTYISKAMDACSKCGGSVAQIPTERELAVSTNRT